MKVVVEALNGNKIAQISADLNIHEILLRFLIGTCNSKGAIRTLPVCPINYLINVQ